MALASVDAYLEAICPLLYAAATRDVYVDIATDATDATFYGTQYYYAIALLAAHNYTIDRNRSDGENGLVTAKTEGRVSIHYWNEIPENSGSTLRMTTYGNRLLQLRKRMQPFISVAGSTLPGLGMTAISETD